MTDIFAALSAPFPPDAVSWRVGSTTGDKTKGMALAYIDSRDVQDRFDAVVGPGNWQRRHPHVGGTTTCEIDVWCEGRGWVTKTDGAGDTDVEAEKGSLSDSFKRAAVNWGVGRYLYGLDAPWVELEPAGRSYKIKKAEYAKLRRVLEDHARGYGKSVATADAPPPRSAAVVAGEASLSKCSTTADYDDWGAKNKSALEGMTKEDRAHLLAMWKSGRAQADAKERAEKAHAAANADPFSEAA